MTGTFAASVQFEGLTKRFGEKTAVDAISFDIPAGSMFGILGPNGAGKSTLIRMATGLLRPDAGKVRIEGIAVWEDPVAAKSRIGVVPDDPTLFDRLSGRELIEFNGLLRRMDPTTIAHRRDELLKLVDLEDDADTLVADYSTGMRRKIAICCALLHNPRVIFLDEPFSRARPGRHGDDGAGAAPSYRLRRHRGLLEPRARPGRAGVRPLGDHRPRPGAAPRDDG